MSWASGEAATVGREIEESSAQRRQACEGDGRASEAGGRATERRWRQDELEKAGRLVNDRRRAVVRRIDT